ncbi:MAG: hypothetical protein ABI877_16705 [Gemmatimonadaceae bacterium]
MTFSAKLFRSRVVRLLVPILAIVAATGCRRHVLAQGVSDSTFVAAMAELRRMPARVMVDSASRMRARDSILKHYGLTVAQLEGAAAALATTPDRAAAIWAEVVKKENSPRDEDKIVPAAQKTAVPGAANSTVPK